MRGLGDFQRAQMKRVDPRLGQLFSNLRQALELLEEILVHPHVLPPAAEQLKSSPAPPPAAS
jgi:hypothetical protein